MSDNGQHTCKPYALDECVSGRKNEVIIGMRIIFLAIRTGKSQASRTNTADSMGYMHGLQIVSTS